MPKLQVDGVMVAEIGEDLAGKLLAAAKVGVGKEFRQPGFPRTVRTDMSKSALSSDEVIPVNLAFPRSG